MINIGEKIKYLRQANGLTQEELADRCELTKGFISQLERNMTSPSIATLIDILDSLGTDLPAFFQEQAVDQIVFSRQDYAVKEDNEMGHEICWLIPNAQKNQMEPIIVTLHPGGQSNEDHPHEGEEFGFVLEGQIIITIGQRKIRARRGDSFKISPTEPHMLSNPGKRIARVLWISTPPSF